MSTTPAWCTQHLPALDGRVALVTGAASGLGFETALGLACRGAQVWLADIDAARTQAVCERIRALAPQAHLQPLHLDLGDQAAIRRFARHDAPARLDILVNNAGLLPPPRRATTRDGFELKFGVNVLGHFTLTQVLLDALRRAPAPRVVWVASLVHRRARLDFDDLLAARHYHPQRVYDRAKLACLMLAMELHARTRQDFPALTSVAAHPGVARTGIGASLRGQPRTQLRDHLIPLALALAMRLFGQSADRGARCILHAAAAQGVNGGDFWGPSGVGEMRGEPCRVSPSAPALDASQRQRLWEACAALVSDT